MLSIRENFLETIHNGHPDRFVKQFEYMARIYDPIGEDCSSSCKRGTTRVNAWGVTITWPQQIPGPMPIHDDAHIALKDITRWKETLRKPDPTIYTQEQWQPALDAVAAVDRTQKFVTYGVGPGILEQIINLMSMTEAMIAFLEEPEAMHELIDFLTDWEIACGQEVLRHYQPELLFHHDDWGSQRSLFLSPKAFEEFLLPAYKKIYGFWKQNGVQVIVHHSDSYAAELVPYMIEMGVDVFQGGVSENNIPKLIREYGSQIAFHTGLDNGKFDVEHFSESAIREELERLIELGGKEHLIPGLTMGGIGSCFPGVYETVDRVIDELSKKYF